MSAGNTADKQSRRRAKRQAENPVTEIESEFEDDDVVESRAVTTSGKGRATPSRRVHEEEVKSGNFITRTVTGMRDYFEGVSSELRKVAWPAREDIQRLTLIVIVVMIASAIALGLISLVFTELFRLGLASPVIFAVFFVIVGVAGFILYRRSQRSDVSPY